MGNELLFLFQAGMIGSCALGALALGRDALIAWIALQAVLANLLTLKQILLFGLTVTTGDIFAVGSILSFNILQEFFGKKMARRSMYISFAAMLAYLFFTQAHLWYIPAPCDFLHDSYAAVLQMMPRLIIASFSTFMLVQCIDMIVYAGFKKLLSGRYVAFRAFVCLLFSQALDTTIFTFLGLYGLIISPLHVIGMSTAIKYVVIVCAVPFVTFARWVYTRSSSLRSA